MAVDTFVRVTPVIVAKAGVLIVTVVTVRISTSVLKVPTPVTAMPLVLTRRLPLPAPVTAGISEPGIQAIAKQKHPVVTGNMFRMMAAVPPPIMSARIAHPIPISRWPETPLTVPAVQIAPPVSLPRVGPKTAITSTSAPQTLVRTGPAPMAF